MKNILLNLIELMFIFKVKIHQQQLIYPNIILFNVNEIYLHSQSVLRFFIQLNFYQLEILRLLTILYDHLQLNFSSLFLFETHLVFQYLNY
jgi:hypothetical protein